MEEPLELVYMFAIDFGTVKSVVNYAKILSHQ